MEKEEISDDNIQLMRTLLSNAYEAEWQVTHDIESKACNSVGFTGIIFTLIIGTLSSFLVLTDESIKEKVLYSSIFSIIIIVCIILSMILSMGFGIMALTVKEWQFPIAKNFMDIYNEAKNNSELKRDLLTSIIATYSSCIDKNGELNEKIASYVKYSHVCFIISIILIAGYFLFIMDVVY